MALITIRRDKKWVTKKESLAIRNAFHRAMVKVLKVKPKDVEVRLRKIKRHDLNSGRLAIEIDTGPGNDSLRIKQCYNILLRTNAHIIADDVVPKRLRKKGRSNMWLRIFAKGASMPIGCLDDMH